MNTPYKLLLSVLLLLAQVIAPSLTGRAGEGSSLHAQTIEDGEAFYIYRNDHNFDGFFYDQVKEMRYSKLDQDSVEQADYVTYEVVTADSIYRIPLAAIDSIGFVQPELKFNPKVRHMDLLGMTPYINEATSLTRLIFNESMPDNLKPKVGDILLGFTGLLEEKGFGGRVTRISHVGKGMMVDCERLTQMADVFDQFITVEQIGTNGDGSREVRRMAGYNQLRKDMVRRASSGGSLTLVDINLNLHLPLIPDISENGGIHCNVDLGGSFKVKMCTVLQVMGNSYFFKTMFNEDYSLQAGVSMGLHGSAFQKLELIKGFAIKFPATCPLFEVRPVPEFGVRYNGDISASVTFPMVSGSLRQTFTMDSDNPGITYQGNEKDPQGDGDAPSSFFDSLEGELKFNGMVQLGIKQPCSIFTNGWFDWIFSAGMGMDIFIGPKVEASINLSVNSLDSGDGIYSLRNSRLRLTKLALDYEAYGEYTDAIMKPNKLKWTFADGSFALIPMIEMYLLPTLNLKTAEYKADAQQIDVLMETDQRMVYFPSEIGLALMDKDKENILASTYEASLGFASFAPADMKTQFSAQDLKIGTYHVVPLLRFLGTEYPIKSKAKRVDVLPYLELSQDSIHVEKGSQEIIIPFKTNASKVEATCYYSSRSWTKAEVVDLNPEARSGKLKITIDKNSTLFDREGIIALTAKDEASGFSSKAEFRITQDYGGVITKVHVGAIFHTTGDPNTNSDHCMNFPIIDVTPSRAGDTVTISASQFYPDKDYAGDRHMWSSEGTNSETSEISFNLVVDLKNKVVLSGSATFAGDSKCDVEGVNSFTHFHDWTNFYATFKNVPYTGVGSYLEGYSSMRFYGGEFIEAGGSENLYDHYKSVHDKEAKTVSYTETITDGYSIEVQLFSSYQE